MSDINLQEIKPHTSFNPDEILLGLNDIGLLKEFMATKAAAGDKTGTFIAGSDDNMVVVMFSNKHRGMLGMMFEDSRFRDIASADGLREIVAPFLKRLGFNITGTVASTDRPEKQEVNSRLFGGNN